MLAAALPVGHSLAQQPAEDGDTAVTRRRSLRMLQVYRPDYHLPPGRPVSHQDGNAGDDSADDGFDNPLAGPLGTTSRVFQASTEPPTREELFSISGEDDLLRRIEEEYRANEDKDPQPFVLPYSVDRFNQPDLETLGPLWRQGRDVNNFRIGQMRVRDQVGVYPAGADPELAVLGLTIGGKDMYVAVSTRVAPGAVFGVAVRCQDVNPGSGLGASGQLENNRFYYAVVDGGQVRFGKHKDGKDRDLRTAALPGDRTVRLAVSAFGDEFVIFAGDAEIMRVSDSDDELDGQYAGVIGFMSGDEPTLLDDFVALPYGGPLMPRRFAATTRSFEAPAVHHGPLYFEQKALERFGHSLGNLPQPLIAHSLVFVDLIALPYSIAKSPPWQIQTAAGMPRPGDVVLPFRLFPPRPDKQGVTAQTALTVLAFALIP